MPSKLPLLNLVGREARVGIITLVFNQGDSLTDNANAKAFNSHSFEKCIVWKKDDHIYKVMKILRSRRKWRI